MPIERTSDRFDELTRTRREPRLEQLDQRPGDPDAARERRLGKPALEAEQLFQWSERQAARTDTLAIVEGRRDRLFTFHRQKIKKARSVDRKRISETKRS